MTKADRRQGVLDWTWFVEWGVRYTETRRVTKLRPVAEVALSSRYAADQLRAKGAPSRGTAARVVLEGAKLEWLERWFELDRDTAEFVRFVVEKRYRSQEELCWAFDKYLRTQPVRCRLKCDNFLQGVR